MVYIAGPCNRAAGQAADDEADGQVGGGAAGQAPSGGRGQGSVEGAKSLKKPICFGTIYQQLLFFSYAFLDFLKPLVKTKYKILFVYVF